MKIGVRKPNLKSSFKARTTGRVKRAMKQSINPLYGKKGMGWINDPKKAFYNKLYRKTTVSAFSLLAFPILIFNLFWNLTVFMLSIVFQVFKFAFFASVGAVLSLFYLAVAIIENISGKELLPQPDNNVAEEN